MVTVVHADVDPVIRTEVAVVAMECPEDRPETALMGAEVAVATTTVVEAVATETETTETTTVLMAAVEAVAVAADTPTEVIDDDNLVLLMDVRVAAVGDLLDTETTVVATDTAEVAVVHDIAVALLKPEDEGKRRSR